MPVLRRDREFHSSEDYGRSLSKIRESIIVLAQTRVIFTKVRTRFNFLNFLLAKSLLSMLFVSELVLLLERGLVSLPWKGFLVELSCSHATNLS
jgi:hypothetical protein